MVYDKELPKGENIYLIFAALCLYRIGDGNQLFRLFSDLDKFEKLFNKLHIL